MNKEEIKKTIDRYNERLEKYGITEKALGWGDKGRSKLRFEILCSEFELENKIILDYGCGYGDLYQYIKDTRTDNFKYIGIDLNENIINIAKSRNYLNADFYVVSGSGIFNYKLNNNIEFIKNTLDIFNANGKDGFAANFLSKKVDFESELNYHSSPSEILDICYEYSNNIMLKNNYMPFEFTVIVNKEEPLNKEFNVYQNFVKYI
jgi:SAM-dependent methyltransferase